MADRATLNKFWMVMGMDQGPPRYRHQTKTSAQKEAQRLAALSPGSVFVVLTAVDGYAAANPVMTRFKVEKDLFPDDIPF